MGAIPDVRIDEAVHDHPELALDEKHVGDEIIRPDHEEKECTAVLTELLLVILAELLDLALRYTEVIKGLTGTRDEDLLEGSILAELEDRDLQCSGSLFAGYAGLPVSKVDIDANGVYFACIRKRLCTICLLDHRHVDGRDDFQVEVLVEREHESHKFIGLPSLDGWNVPTSLDSVSGLAWVN